MKRFIYIASRRLPINIAEGANSCYNYLDARYMITRKAREEVACCYDRSSGSRGNSNLCLGIEKVQVL